MNTHGSTLRAVVAILGALFIMAAIYFLGRENYVYAAGLGVPGLLIIVLSLFPIIFKKG